MLSTVTPDPADAGFNLGDSLMYENSLSHRTNISQSFCRKNKFQVEWNGHGTDFCIFQPLLWPVWMRYYSSTFHRFINLHLCTFIVPCGAVSCYQLYCTFRNK